MSNYVNRTGYFREIQASLNGKTARYPTRREPNIMDIESNTCGLEVPHGDAFISSISKLKKLSKRVNGLHEIKR